MIDTLDGPERVEVRVLVAKAILQVLRSRAQEDVLVLLEPDELEIGERALAELLPCLHDRELLRKEGFPLCFRPDLGLISRRVRLVTSR